MGESFDYNVNQIWTIDFFQNQGFGFLGKKKFVSNRGLLE